VTDRPTPTPCPQCGAHLDSSRLVTVTGTYDCKHKHPRAAWSVRCSRGCWMPLRVEIDRCPHCVGLRPL
jgi:hypothetical protein